MSSTGAEERKPSSPEQEEWHTRWSERRYHILANEYKCWNMGFASDLFRYVGEDPVNRQYHHNLLTFSSSYMHTERFVLPISHDEVVHGKGSMLRKAPGDPWRQYATLRAVLAFMWAHPGRKLLFMGTEFGQDAEWAESRPLSWEQLSDPLSSGVLSVVGALNMLHDEHRALWEQDDSPAGFEWIEADDNQRNVYAFVRWSRSGAPVVCVANFAAVPHEGYSLGLPSPGRWREVLNTDAAVYGGSGVGNLGVVEAFPDGAGRAVASLRVPPLGVLWLVPESLVSA